MNDRPHGDSSHGNAIDCIICGTCVADILVRPVPLSQPVGAGRLFHVEPIEVTTGGIVCNSGTAMRRLGLRVAAASLLGNDLWADVVRSRLAAEGIDTAALTAHTESIFAASEACPWQPAPIFCAVDQEGGLVARLRKPFTELPPMRKLGENGDDALIAAVGKQLGRECLAAGFNLDFTPVLDVDTNPDNPIIGNRSFSRDPHQVAHQAGVLLDGLQSEGVMGCGKHFPGHGDTNADSHLELPVLTHDLHRLKDVELVPFAALARRLPMVMTAHVLFRALDATWPATVSPEILRPLLRAHCGFDGVIVSDDLEMHGIAQVLEPGEAVRRGIEAGCDNFLVCRRQDTFEAALQGATNVLLGKDGEVQQTRALESVARVRRLRARLVRPRPSAAGVASVLSHPETLQLREELARL